MCIYVWSPPPIRQTPELYFQSVQEVGGRPTLQTSSSCQKSQNLKNPTQVSDFWKLEREPQNSKNPKLLEFPKIQNSKNSNPSFGFLETRAAATSLSWEGRRQSAGLSLAEQAVAATALGSLDRSLASGQSEQDDCEIVSMPPLPSRTPLTPSQFLSSTFLNPSVLCYLNSTIVALIWTVLPSLTCTPTSNPHMSALLSAVANAGGTPVRLDRLLRAALQGWECLYRQHDVCEFLAFIGPKLCPTLAQGQWQCRRMRGDYVLVTDKGTTAQPLALNPHSKCTLDAMLHRWTSQSDRCALVRAPQLLSVAAPRFRNAAGGFGKHRVMLQLLQPEINLPLFTGPGLRVVGVNYRLRACIFHRGNSVHTGHYQVLLADAHDHWHITDDGSPAKSCTYVEANHLAGPDGYVLLYDKV